MPGWLCTWLCAGSWFETTGRASTGGNGAATEVGTGGSGNGRRGNGMRGATGGSATDSEAKELAFAVRVVPAAGFALTGSPPAIDPTVF